jgi:formylglycine-generating enzyme required for sulfatase activity
LAIVSLFAAVLGLTSEAWAQVKPDDVIEEVEAALEPVDQVIGEARTVLGQCPGNGSDDVMTTVGPLCVDVYEASLWSSRRGGTPVAASTCNPNGNDCTSIFARSLAGVTPSFDITWFQAQQACANSGKRLLTNAEWQMAAAGTPDYSTNSTDCNTLSGSVANTGAFATCFSNHGVHDMVGNLYEWVADWVPRSTGCGSWDFSDDEQCLSGAATSGEPGALIRGGWFSSASNAGVFAVFGAVQPSGAGYNLGFRCAR